MKFSASSGGKHQQTQDGFTLIDLIAAVALTAVLGGFLFSARATTRPKSGIMGCKNNLRQVGFAIEQYAQDNTNSLPGPLWTGVWFAYRKTGDSHSPTTWSLPYHLTQYLGLPAPDGTYREAAVLKCPASEPYLRVQTNSIQFSGICYMSSSTITNRSGPNPEINHYPFGRPSTPTMGPMKITDIRRPSEQWALVDADQKNVPSGATYFLGLAPEPVHNNRPGGPRSSATSFPVGNRNYLYFDGSVRSALAAGSQ